jgi:hypothetical protein
MNAMNGNEPQIEIFRPFGEAFEWMKKMLFQPFDIAKWLVVGFAAFLSNLSGNANFNYSRNIGRGGDWNFRSMSHDGAGASGSREAGEWLASCAIPLIVLLVLVVLAIIVAVLWVGCRGRFIFTDCIVHNRGAIAAPWREYRREGNSFFFFSLIVGLVVLAIIAIAFVPVLLPFIQGWTEGTAFVASLTVGIVLVVGVILLITAAWGLISQLMVPVMYRQRCLALVAFREVVGLITARPGPMILYLLFFFVLGLGAAMIACVSIPLTCCITMIPYVGTVALLPIYVVLAAFPLFFLRQFGPDYDVWAAPAPQELPAPEISQAPPPPDTPV